MRQVDLCVCLAGDPALPCYCGGCIFRYPSRLKGADIANFISTPAVQEFWGCRVPVLEEIGKQMPPTHPGADINFHLETLHTLLKLMDGGVITGRKGNRIYCIKILVIGVGAFTPLRGPEKGVKTQRVGFFPEAPQSIQAPAGGENNQGANGCILRF